MARQSSWLVTVPGTDHPFGILLAIAFTLDWYHVYGADTGSSHEIL
jgi:hypothetical protein